MSGINDSLCGSENGWRHIKEAIGRHMLSHIGQTVVFVSFFLIICSFFLGFKIGELNERMLDMESISTGQGLNKMEYCKWLIQNQEQKLGE